MEEELKLISHAKVNLTLDVLGKRDDNYHNVEMIMQTIDLSDKLSFIKIKEGIEILTNNPQLPVGEDNLIYQAASLLFNEFNLNGGLKIELNKEIPIAAGLAGGSSNAAATLVAINKLWDLGLTTEELVIRGKELGADVPFCIEGGTKLATGIGTELEALPEVPELYLIVVNPPLEVSTARVYGELDINKRESQIQTDKVIKELKRRDEKLIVDNMANLLEGVTLNMYPQVLDLKIKVEELTQKALMAGSGPTILGFVKDSKEAKQIKSKLHSILSPDYRIIVTKTIDCGVKEV